MVAQAVIDDLHVFRDEIERARVVGGATREELTVWVGVLDYIACRLEGRPCPDCGEQMQYDATLEAHVCSHYESESAA